MPTKKPFGTFSDESLDLQKQIGCMAGIFQIFDRHQLLTRRHLGRHSQKRLHSGHAPGNSSSNTAAHNGLPRQVTLVSSSILCRSLTEHSSLSMESSGASCSSSSCSSFSSLDCNKSVQPELPSINEVFLSHRTSKDSPRSVKTPTLSSQQHTYFRDVVKDSINREPRSLSVKTSAKEEMKNKELKHRDSPRPLLISKSMDGTYVIGIDKTTTMAAEVCEKLKEAPFKFPEYEARQERSRLSVDGREFSQRSVGPRDNSKSATKLKELPRLSLDSRKEYLRNSNTDEESSSLKRSSSIIAKLMGLEALPNSSTTEGHNASGVEKSCILKASLKPVQESKDDCPPFSLILKAKSSSRIVTETAPWRQQDRGGAPRIAKFEFQEFNRDLRALKQILNAMNPKEPLELKGSNHQSSISSVYQAFSTQTPTRRDKNLRLSAVQNPEAQTNCIPTNYRSPIVVMKSAKSLGKLSVSATTTTTIAVLESFQSKRKCSIVSIKDKQQNPTDKVRSHVSREHGGNSLKTSSSLSPRLLQRKAELEKKARRQSYGESVSPRNRLQSGTSQAKSSESKILSHEQDEAMQTSHNDTSMAVAVHDSAYILNSKESSMIPNKNASDKEIATAANENILSPVSVLDALFYKDGLSPVQRISHELKDGEIHNSEECWNPVSLPNTPPSKASGKDNPMKDENIRTLIQKLEQLSSAEDELSSSDPSALTIGENKDHQYIYEILSASGLLKEDLSFIPPFPSRLQQSTYPINPDLFLVLEHAKSDWISKPEADHVTILQSKLRSEKLHRKLVFDAVNEIIAHKLELVSSTHRTIWFIPTKKLSGQQLLKELCVEIDRLQTESSEAISHDHDRDDLIYGDNVLRQMKGWESCGSEIQGMVLDIERSLFKDLIDEVVSGETAASRQAKQHRLRRQLFEGCMN